jgi:hypothetical protein
MSRQAAAAVLGADLMPGPAAMFMPTGAAVELLHDQPSAVSAPTLLLTGFVADRLCC